ncbi:MAG TPA: Fur family transcriptional regulator [Polyangiaceae bacterium]|nr:Fur family transcriptional regulator [Polyangiaceae bacterium]
MSDRPKDALLGDKPKAPNLDRLRQNLDEYMNEKGLRTTEQRSLIIKTLFDSGEHLTIDELLERVRAVDSRVGYATVYRTMKMLAEGGIANELHFGSGVTRYEVADEDAHHDHLICEECGQIIEFEEPLIEELQERIAARYGFVVTHHKHELYGHCADREACAVRQKR